MFSDVQKKCDKVSTYQPLTLSSYFPLKVHFMCKRVSKIESYAFSELSFSCIARQGPWVRLAVFKRKRKEGICNDYSEKFCILSLDIFAYQIKIYFF